MKKIILSLLFSIPVFAQDGFKVENNELVWEKTFEANNANIVSVLDRHPELAVSGFIDNAYKGAAKEIANTCQGGSALMKNNVKFDFIILVNPDYYVVRLKNLKVLEKYGPMQTRIIANRMDQYFTSNGVLRTDDKAFGDMQCMDSFLSGVFGIISSQGGALTSN
ncbi:hypothetical protein VF13_37545 [Nostoc linckia z16]|nr:hypothetical protein VF13_37545 [Nostoc linckia z16]